MFFPPEVLKKLSLNSMNIDVNDKKFKPQTHQYETSHIVEVCIPARELHSVPIPIPNPSLSVPRLECTTKEEIKKFFQNRYNIELIDVRWNKHLKKSGGGYVASWELTFHRSDVARASSYAGLAKMDVTVMPLMGEFAKPALATHACKAVIDPDQLDKFTKVVKYPELLPKPKI